MVCSFSSVVSLYPTISVIDCDDDFCLEVEFDDDLGYKETILLEKVGECVYYGSFEDLPNVPVAISSKDCPLVAGSLLQVLFSLTTIN